MVGRERDAGLGIVDCYPVVSQYDQLAAHLDVPTYLDSLSMRKFCERSAARLTVGEALREDFRSK
jgi:hypothetical protein